MGLNLFSHAADGFSEEARVVVPLADAAPSVGPRAVLTGDCHASIFRILGGIAPRARVGRPTPVPPKTRFASDSAPFSAGTCKMVRSRDVTVLEDMAAKVSEAAERRDRVGVLRWARRFVAMNKIVDAASRGRRSPSHYMTQASLPASSTWAAIKKVRDDGAFMQFLGVPTFLFDLILTRFKDHLPARLVRRDEVDKSPQKSGRPASTFDASDILALALRRAQLLSGTIKLLQFDFGLVDSTLGPYIEAGRTALLQSLRSWLPAAVAYPSANRAAHLMAALVERAGQLPRDFDPGNCVIAVDGTATDIAKVGNRSLTN